MSNIQSDPGWARAAGQQATELREDNGRLDQFMNRSGFWKDISLLGVAQVRKKYKEDESKSEMAAINSHKEFVDALEKRIKQVTAMQTARTS
eukprot:12118270-Alexandrium_andersonii.AAC.1